MRPFPQSKGHWAWIDAYQAHAAGVKLIDENRIGGQPGTLAANHIGFEFGWFAVWRDIHIPRRDKRVPVL